MTTAVPKALCTKGKGVHPAPAVIALAVVKDTDSQSVFPREGGEKARSVVALDPAALWGPVDMRSMRDCNRSAALRSSDSGLCQQKIDWRPVRRALSNPNRGLTREIAIGINNYAPGPGRTEHNVHAFSPVHFLNARITPPLRHDQLSPAPLLPRPPGADSRHHPSQSSQHRGRK